MTETRSTTRPTIRMLPSVGTPPPQQAVNIVLPLVLEHTTKHRQAKQSSQGARTP